MDDKEYELVCEVQDAHWWWLGRKKILEGLIESCIGLSKKLSIADVGCGGGANIPFLRQYGDVTGLELNDAAINFVHSKWGESVKLIKWKSPETVPHKYDLILLADVLEHIPDERQAVAWIYEHLNARGHALLTVPAHPFLWSQMDEVVHHYRRYSRKHLLSLFGERFHVVRFSYYNFFLFPVKICFVIFARTLELFFPRKEKRSYNDVPPAFINGIFKYILYLEAELIRLVSLPFGVSMVLLIQKRDGAETC